MSTDALVADNTRLRRELAERVAQLERERDFIRTIVDSTSSLFSVLDPEGVVVRYNESLARLSGRFDDENTRGRPFWTIFVVAEERDEVRTRLAGEDGVEHENRFLRRGRPPATVAWSRCSLVDDEGRPQILFTGVDVTLRKEHEEEVHASRARIVEAADAARRTLERNLHDGAQQRLVTLSLLLRIARSSLAAGDVVTLDDQLRDAQRELAEALAELRELARGLHPSVLAERGLIMALDGLAARATVPVVVDARVERLDPQVEAALYYVVAEGLTNVARYAHANEATVRVFHDGPDVVAEVVDDGVGGADLTGGSGLRGLSDRLATIEGTLTIVSPGGRGTRIRARVPA